ncbi:TPA: arginase [Escherichia coli]|nr:MULTISPECIES: arginase [Escherichia]MED9104917.1 arginase [Escherichia coli]
MSPTPAGSGKSARPVPGRTRDTDHRQRSCRAASASAVKRGARRHLLLPAQKTQIHPNTHQKNTIRSFINVGIH